MFQNIFWNFFLKNCTKNCQIAKIAKNCEGPFPPAYYQLWFFSQQNCEYVFQSRAVKNLNFKENQGAQHWGETHSKDSLKRFSEQRLHKKMYQCPILFSWPRARHGATNFFFSFVGICQDFFGVCQDCCLFWGGTWYTRSPRKRGRINGGWPPTTSGNMQLGMKLAAKQLKEGESWHQLTQNCANNSAQCKLEGEKRARERKDGHGQRGLVNVLAGAGLFRLWPDQNWLGFVGICYDLSDIHLQPKVFLFFQVLLTVRICPWTCEEECKEGTTAQGGGFGHCQKPKAWPKPKKKTPGSQKYLPWRGLLNRRSPFKRFHHEIVQHLCRRVLSRTIHPCFGSASEGAKEGAEEYTMPPEHCSWKITLHWKRLLWGNFVLVLATLMPFKRHYVALCGLLKGF